MGRDQAHGGGDLTNAALLARMMLAQGTEVDPVDGTVSTAEDAVGPYEFLNDRILDAADYFWQFMLGYDTEWTPVGYAISPDGTIRDTYDHISNSYRGRYTTASFWEIYYHYRFTLGEDVEAMAPYFAEAYAKRPGPLFHRGGGVGNYWDGVDGGGDSWLFAPASAAGESTPPLGDQPAIYEVEERYTHLAGEVERGDDYVSMGEGAKIAYLNGETSRPRLAFRVRTEGESLMYLGSPNAARSRTIIVPDTGGEWRNVTVDGAMGDMLIIETEGAQVDIDHININAATELTPPGFPDDAPGKVVAWEGAAITADLSATAAEGTVYSAAGLPAGADFDAETGALTWSPDEKGTYTVTVAADDGINTAARRVTFEIAADRGDAIAAAEDGIDLSDGYESATETAFNEAHDTAEDLREHGSGAEYLAALGDLVSAVESLRLISPKSAVNGTIDYPGLLAASTAGTNTANLVDGSNQTGTGYGQAVNLSHVFDFGPDFRVSATKFGFQSNIFADRLATSAVFGSNDGTTWTRLTPGEADYTQDYNTEAVAPDLKDDQFRYIKVQLLDPQPDVLYGIYRNLFEMTEFHIYGERHEIGNLISSASIAAEDAVAGKVAIGDTVTATVTTKRPVDALSVDVMGLTAEAVSEDGVTWTAAVPLDGVEAGQVTFAVDYTADGEAGATFHGTTDGSKLFVGGNRDQRIDVADLATVTASDKQWPGNGLPADEVGYLLFDGDAATAGDLNSSGAYYTLDFGDGAAVDLDEGYLLPRACCAARANGVVIQGSNDGSNWTGLTDPVTGAVAGTWTRRAVVSDTAYRYFRIYNANSWNGNLAEVELYGDLTPDSA
jgi:hypothetical protein